MIEPKYILVVSKVLSQGYSYMFIFRAPTQNKTQKAQYQMPKTPSTEYFINGKPQFYTPTPKLQRSIKAKK